MAISTYDALVAEVAAWSHDNDDLAPRIPGFIALAEARIKALLHSRGQGEAVPLAASKGSKTITLPADLLQIRSASIPGVSPALDYITPAEHATKYAVGTGIPREYTIVDGLMYLGPAPDAAYSVALVYEASYPPLSPASQTNGLLTKWPNLYLWGAMCEAASFTEDDKRLAKYEAKFAAAMGSINTIESSASGQLTVRADTRNC